MTTITLILFIIIIPISCSSQSDKIPEEYKDLALEMFNSYCKKPVSEFTEDDYLQCYKMFMNSYNFFLLEHFPPSKEDTQDKISIYLDLAFKEVKSVVNEYAPTYRDSLIGLYFFMGFTNMQPYSDEEKELLKEARLTDYLEAYIKYMPEYASNNYKPVNHPTFELLGLSVNEPSDYFDIGPKEKAFAYIRINILRRKINSSLSEKQKMLMEENRIMFLQSLNEKQSAMYREFSKYLDYLE